MNTQFETKLPGNKAATHDWLTPPYILEALGEFDLDPCASMEQPWRTAKEQFTVEDDGLNRQWSGRVWCNPPYGDNTVEWLRKCSEHGNAIVLIFARTETQMFFRHIWDKAHGLFFIQGRLRFYLPGGVRGGTAGAPSVLVAYGEDNADVLRNCGLRGKWVQLKEE